MIILLQVGDDRASEALLRGIASLGHDVRPVKLPSLPSTGEDPGLIVCDLYPWTTVALKVLRQVRAARPTLPILLYPPQFFHKEVAALLLQCADVGGLSVFPQDPRASTKDLAAAVNRALASTPSLVLERLIALLFAGEEFAHGRAFVLRILTTLRERTASWRSPGVATIAAEMNAHPRQLERDHRKVGLASPRTVLQYVLLLWVLGIGAFTRLRFDKAAVASGLNGKRMQRLRATLLATFDVNAPPDQLFDIAFLKFAEACRVPRQRAEEALRARAG